MDAKKLKDAKNPDEKNLAYAKKILDSTIKLVQCNKKIVKKI